MVITKDDQNIKTNVRVDKETIDQTDTFSYLGSVVTSDGGVKRKLGSELY